VKRALRRTNLSLVVKEKPGLEQIHYLIDKPYYVDQIKYKIE
jgi:hypothetical protein